MADFNIYIDGGFIYVTDVPVTLEWIRNLRSDTTFEFDEPNSTFQFYWNTPDPNGTVNRFVLGGNNIHYLYSDLIAVTETIDGTPTVIPIANARALASYLATKIGFFFNPNPVDVEIVGSLNENVISAANSTTALLGSGATFTGAWEEVIVYTTVATAVLGSLATDGTLYFDLSTDGGVTFTSVPSVISDATFAVPRILNVVETHVRIRYVNGTTAQTGTFSIQTKYSNNQELALLSSIEGVINGETPTQVVRSVVAGRILNDLLEDTDDFGNVSLLSNRALKTAIPPTVIYQISRPTDPAIPTGAAITIDPVLNTELNVSDSGWIPVKSFGGGSLINMITDTSLQVYLMNASDTSGNNIQGNLSPSIISTIGFPSTFGAPFFDDYFRLVVVNVSGSSSNSYSIKAVGQQTPAAPVFNSIDQPIASFFPAPLNRSVITGLDVDGVFHNVVTTRNGNIAQSVTDADLGFHQIVTPGGASKVASQTHLVGEPFGGAELNTTEWDIDLVGSGTQDATGAGELTMDTGTTADSAVEIESSDLARFIPANYNTTHHAVTIPDGASYAADNSRKWGAFEATNAAGGNGIYFEIDDGVWYVAHCLNGTPTRIEQDDWNGLGAGSFPTNSINANVYEIEYNAGSIIFRVNSNVLHRETLLATPYANDIHFPIGMSNTNYNGSTTDVSLKLRAASIYTLGKGLGQERPFYISGTNGAGDIVKTGAGHLGRVIFARAGGGSATVLIYDALIATNQVGRIDIDKNDTINVEYDFTFNIGLFVVITGTGTLGTTITFD